MTGVERRSVERHSVERLRQLAHLLDDRFRIPGTRYRIGLDGLIGLVPGIGDAVTTVLALYIVLEARRLGVPLTKVGRMGLNVAVDAVLGAVPLVGDLFDVAWKANRRNLGLLLDHLESERQTLDPQREALAGSEPAPHRKEI
ncbi:MAG: DUF4112 domain-containing protein [Geminicoccaceae bacterium]